MLSPTQTSIFFNTLKLILEVIGLVSVGVLLWFVTPVLTLLWTLITFLTYFFVIKEVYDEIDE